MAAIGTGDHDEDHDEPHSLSAGQQFIAGIGMAGFDFAPREWAFTDGQTLSISQNSALFSLIGTTYGGDGRTTFELPDFRGRGVVGAETVSQAGVIGGIGDVTLTVAQIPAHTHDIMLPLVVDITVDEDDGNIAAGDLSLREAIRLANLSPETKPITFAPSLLGETITLTMGELLISQPVSIIGPGADLLTINADQLSRIFSVDDGTADNIEVEIAGLTLTGGRTETPAGENFRIGSGGAVRSFESLSVRESTISGNTTVGVAFGGGIFTGESGDLTVRNSTLSGNAAYSGGAIINYSTGPALIDNTTISGNTATSYAGGGIFNQHDLTITNSTITENIVNTVSSFAGAGGLHTRGNKNVEISNTIIAGNQRQTASGLVDDDVRDTNSQLSVDHNLFGVVISDDIVDGVDGNMVGVTDPNLGPLADNGGPTLTHALLPGSPAIDAIEPLITPVGVTSNTSATDLFPVGQLIDGSGLPGLTFGNYAGRDNVGDSATNSWVTRSPGVDYYATDDPIPELIFDLGAQSRLLTDIVVWGYVFPGIVNNEAKTFEISFSTDGGASYGSAVTLDHARTGRAVETLSLGGEFPANTVRLRITDNHFGTPGAAGGDRVGLSEVRFLSVPDFDQRGTPFQRVVGTGTDIGAFETQSIDFGDAPDSYPGDASHRAIGPQLGDNRDGDLRRSASEFATGDDTTGDDDEDGVLFGTIVPGTMAGINIDLQNAEGALVGALVDAWIDFNGDGDWDDAGEKILTDEPVTQGLQTKNYPVPAGSTVGTTFARIRVSTEGGLSPTGPAPDGEVEDYAVTIGAIGATPTATINAGRETRSEITSIEVDFGGTSRRRGK